MKVFLERFHCTYYRCFCVFFLLGLAHHLIVIYLFLFLVFFGIKRRVVNLHLLPLFLQAWNGKWFLKLIPSL
jgi:hypothetical protein